MGFLFSSRCSIFGPHCLNWTVEDIVHNISKEGRAIKKAGGVNETQALKPLMLGRPGEHMYIFRYL